MTGLFLLPSCKGRLQSEEAVQTGEEEVTEDDDEEEMDTLVYDITEAPLTEAVDESFMDFFYTFQHRRGFQLERVKYPVMVTDGNGEIVDQLKNGRSVSQAIETLTDDYFVMLLDEHQDPYDYLDNANGHAEIQKVHLHSGQSQSYSFDKMDGEWFFTGIHEETLGVNAAFVKFLYHFTTDSIYRDEHLADEIFITLPSDEDEMEMMDGNIAPDQWTVFAPEMPHETMLLLDFGNNTHDVQTVKMVKCSIASSMLEILTFRKEDDGWKLVKYEE